MVKITDQSAADPLTGSEDVLISQLSTSVTITATTISAANSDNSYNDSGSGFGSFSVGDRIKVQGFTGDTANNIHAAVVTAATSAKLTIGGTDGDVIVDDAAGESVTITKWVSRRTTPQGIANLWGPTLIVPADHGFSGDSNNYWDLSTYTLDSGNEIDIDLTGFKSVKICITGAAFASSDRVQVILSDDGGTSYHTTSGDYNVWTDGATNLASTSIVVSDTGTTAGAGQTEIIGLNTAGLEVTSSGLTGSSSLQNNRFYRFSGSTSAINAMRIFSNSGNAATGGLLFMFAQ